METLSYFLAPPTLEKSVEELPAVGTGRAAPAVPPIEGIALEVTVKATSPYSEAVRVDDASGQQYMLNRRVLGPLWGRVQPKDRLVLLMELVPGEPSKILSVSRP